MPRIVTQFTLFSSVNITRALGPLELGHCAPSKLGPSITSQKTPSLKKNNLSIKHRRKAHEQKLVCELVLRASSVCPKKSTPPLQRISAYVVAFCTKRNAVFKGLGGGKDNRLSSVSLAPPPPSLTATNPSVATSLFTLSVPKQFFLLISFFSLEQVPQWKNRGKPPIRQRC